ncbi:conserved hypothetical protein [Xylanimonas cellulosilytica DSM 15894]|uniref:Antitoxin FitA-like ribbon-helix-helix domain-containing protein n=1 Tax=Xylanimonas cellulosilytica (strain DSM 15894 / JCM 12276 / CECT 5975 / KCTC 9989 / LMG 20990 / NBRC 107835 / XIL07) TaxID=446471 RepID=D1C0G0_XYLCX|nr:hypothetical protein [Xylanimonas cellulosilytica]ACZ32163.1 conserved hypothetical protein [Xylanimonas cellulosilytica DSM 15894]
MSTLQVRNVPDDVGRVLKQRAARAGQSLSEYVLAQLRALADRPTIDELNARIETRGRVSLGIDTADVLAASRARDAE